ncbi:MAG: hypothetical protein ACI94D_002729, partial [Neolewinella sp.]
SDAMQKIFGGSRNKNARSENLVLFYSRSLATEIIFCARRGKIRRPKSNSY